LVITKDAWLGGDGYVKASPYSDAGGEEIETTWLCHPSALEAVDVTVPGGALVDDSDFEPADDYADESEHRLRMMESGGVGQDSEPYDPDIHGGDL
jgi:hypothetical protein